MTGNLFNELKRRKVFKVGATYLVVAWLAIQAASIAFPAFDAPPWALRVFILVALLGFPLAVVMAWVLEATPEGVRVDPITKGTKRIVFVAIALAVLALGWYFRGQPAFRASDAATATTPVGAASSRDPAQPRTPISNQSIAVLPFENLSADPDNAFFATGIQDEILTSLAKIGGLKVISRTSTIKYGTKPPNLGEIAKELGVANILEGSVQRVGNSVRVNVQLIDARTDQHRWAESYDRDLKNVFAVQSEVAQTIAKALDTKLTSAERAAITAPPTTNGKAYEHYLRGLAILLQAPNYERSSTESSIRELEQAIALDPNFTLAYSNLVFQDTWFYFTGFDPSKARLAKARASLERAEALDPKLPAVRGARAWYLYYGQQDFAGALAIMRQINLDSPNDARGWYITGLLSRRVGDFDGAIAAFRRGRTLSPNDYSIVSELGLTLWNMHRFPEALAAIDSALDQQPNDAAMLSVKQVTLWELEGLAGGARMLAAVELQKPSVVGLRALQAQFERDDVRAAALYERAITGAKDEDFGPISFSGYLPVTVDFRLNLAAIEARRGDRAAADQRYRGLITDADAALPKAENPYVRSAWYAARGMALAGIGRKADAVAAGKRAVATVPMAKDHFEGSTWPAYLARIHAMNGEAADAVAQLRVARSGGVGFDTPAMLRMDPVWDGIRGSAEFRGLLGGQ